MALNTSIRTVTCHLQSGVCWHRFVDVNIWMTSAHAHTHLHCVHICMHTVMGYTHSNDFSHLSLVCKYRNVQTSAVVDTSLLQKEKLVFEAFLGVFKD